MRIGRHIATGITAVSIVGVGLSCAPIAANASDSWVIKTRVQKGPDACGDPGKQRSIRRLGPIAIPAKTNQYNYPKYADVRDAIGSPNKLRRPYESEATALWTGRKAARMTFVSFGGETALSYLPFQLADPTGKKWVTSRGIRVGSAVSKLRGAYGREAWELPATSYWPGEWWRLSGSCSPITGEDDAAVAAKVRNNRVVKLRVWIGAAGE